MRTCDDPPARNGGKECAGDRYQVRKCDRGTQCPGKIAILSFSTLSMISDTESVEDDVIIKHYQ